MYAYIGNWRSEKAIYVERKTEEYISNENLEDISVEPELGEEQLVFRKGRGTTDGMFSLRQLIENRLEKQGHILLWLL